MEKQNLITKQKRNETEVKRAFEANSLKTETIKKTQTINMSSDEAKGLIDSIGPSLGCDLTYDPVYPKTRKDVAGVRRLAENGSTYGYDTIYIVYKTKSGLHYKELYDSSSTKDYIDIPKVTETKDSIIVTIRSGGSYGGKAFEKGISVSKKEIGLR